jgi:prepilin-type N-terminal cleavage/methylation domain-containing protein/prepilin-type processing-associated H-X9-DG protein
MNTSHPVPQNRRADIPVRSNVRTLPALESAAAANRAAFTLVELLVVLLLLGLGAMLMAPALARTRPNNHAAQCLNNMRQLMSAMTLYTHDNYELFPPNPDDGTTLPGYDWAAGMVSGWMPNMSSGGSPDAGNPDRLKNRSTSLLALYLGGNVAVFKCPTDPRVCPYNGTDPAQAGTIIPVVRSVSMNQGVGTVDPGYANGMNHSGKPTLPVNGPWLNGSHSHRANQPYATFGKTSDFTLVSPSSIWVLADDDPWSINDASMAVVAAQPQFIDYPTTMHDNGADFSFADGHAEIHQWTSRLLIHTNIPSRTYPQSAAEKSDWFWFASHATRSTLTGTVP